MTRITLEQRRLHDDLGCAPELMPEDERERVYGETQDWQRTSGGCICNDCGKLYYDHRSVLGALWLTRLCDGRFVKL
jgi:hypothetical protein